MVREAHRGVEQETRVEGDLVDETPLENVLCNFQELVHNAAMKFILEKNKKLESTMQEILKTIRSTSKI